MTENQSHETTLHGSYKIESLETHCHDDGKDNRAPDPRGGATLTQVNSGEVYLIGGANREGQSFGDVHCFDLEAKEWTTVIRTDAEFDPRSGHSAVAIGDCIYVFGGMNPSECVLYDDVCVFNTQTQRWTKPLVEGWMPSARNAHAAINLPVCDGYERILVYGGSSPEAGAFDDVYILHLPMDDRDAPVRWERQECRGSDIPEARELHVATYLTPTTILFSGGRNRDGNICTDMAVLNIGTWEWQLIPICEWNRCSHVAAAIDGAVLSFGGFDGGRIRGDCWEYADNEESWLRACISTPSKADRDAHPENSDDWMAIPERFGHCGCAAELSRVDDKSMVGLLIFGGMNAEQDLNDLVLITTK